MKTMARLCVFLLAFFLALSLSANPRRANTINFDEEWRFHLGEVTGGQEANFDDSRWRTVDLAVSASCDGRPLDFSVAKNS